MKTNPIARRVRRTRMRVAGLAVVATALLSLWTVRFCCSNLGSVPSQYIHHPQGGSGCVTVSELFVAVR